MHYGILAPGNGEREAAGLTEVGWCPGWQAQSDMPSGPLCAVECSRIVRLEIALN